MYKAYLNDGLYILDPSRDLIIDDPVVDLADNSAGSFVFRIYDDNPGYEAVQQLLTTYISVTRDGEYIFRGRIKATEKDFYGGLRVECEGDLAFLDDTIQPPCRYQGKTVQEYLEAVLAVHNSNVDKDRRFTVGLVTVQDEDYNNLYRFTNFESTLTAIKEDLLDSFGGHLRIRYEDGGRYLDYLKECPRVADQKIEFGENLLDFTETLDATDIATAVIPIGAVIDGEEFVEGLDKRVTIETVNNGSQELILEDAVKQFGKITKSVIWSDVHVPSILKRKGQQWLEDAQYASVELLLTAVDLGDFGLHPDKFRLLDNIVCTSKPHGMNRQFPLLKMQIHLLSPESNQYTLGESAKTYTGMTSRAEKEIKGALDILPSESSTLKKAQDYVKTLMNVNGKNGHIVYRENEILIMDTTDIDTAKNVWRYNLAGWAHSSKGYGGPYNAATTSDGLILGEAIAAGSITAEKLDVAYTESVDTKIIQAASQALDDVDDKLKDYWTAGVTETKLEALQSAINLSVNQSLAGYAADLTELRQDTSSQIALTTDAILQMVDKEQVIHSLNLLEGTQLWNRGTITGTKTVDGSVIKLSGSGELFELNQSDIDIIPNSWYTLSAYISGSGTIKLQLSGLPFKIDTDADSVSTGTTEISETMITVKLLSLIHISEPTRQEAISYAVFWL